VNRIYTDLAVIEVTPNGFRLVELSPGIDFDFVQERTAAPLLRNPNGTPLLPSGERGHPSRAGVKHNGRH
jgi:acyl CoA:acetate/3-ketoacid CoA transferase beta subunit